MFEFLVGVMMTSLFFVNNAQNMEATKRMNEFEKRIERVEKKSPTRFEKNPYLKEAMEAAQINYRGAE